ncbi:hypothetical protein BH09VER1_BH09VER1_28630 [soil metagenome]
MSGIQQFDINDPEAADEAYDKALAVLQEANPELFTNLKLKLPQAMFRSLVRTFFYLGFQAGEANALSKLES